MKIIKISDAPMQKNPHGIDVRKLYDTQHAQAVVITLQPGEQLKRHITPVDAIFFVLEGLGTVEVGGEKEDVGPNTLIDSPAKIPHCWYNESDALVRVLVIKVPRQENPTKFL